MSFDIKKLKLRDIAEIVGGGTPTTAKSEYWNGTIPWLTPKDLSNNDAMYIGKGERYITQKGLNESSAKLLPEGTVLFSSRAPIGYLAIAKNKITTNQGFKSLVVKKEHSNIFIYYLLKHLTPYIKSIANGSTFQEISGTDLGNIEVIVPSLVIQNKISLCLLALDNKISKLKETNQTLESIAQTMFKSWFVNFDPVHAKAQGRKCAGIDSATAELFPDSFEDSEIGKIPKGWDIKKLNEAIDFKEGPGIRNWQYTNSEDGVRFINIRCIQGGDLSLDTANRVTEAEGMGKYLHFHLQPMDIVVSTSGTLGRSAIVRQSHLPLILNTSVIRFRNIKNVSTFSYIYLYLNGKDFLFTLNAMATGSVQKNFGPMHLNQMKMLIPDFNTLEKFEQLCDPIFKKILKNRDLIESLANIRDTILPRLISGKLDLSAIEEVLEGVA